WTGDASGAYGSFVIDPATGEWTYVVNPALPTYQGLAQGESATETFTVTVTDEKGGFATVDVTVTVTGANDAPVAVDDGPVVVTEFVPVAIDALGNDTDVDGDVLSITHVDGEPI